MNINLFKKKEEPLLLAPKKTKMQEIVEHKLFKPVLCTTGVIIVGAVIFGTGAGSTMTDVNSEKANGLPVEVTEIEKTTISNDVVYGTKIEAESTIPLVLKIAGKVEEVYATLGDVVAKDQVLFKLDEKDLRKNVNSLSAQYSAAAESAKLAQMNYNSTIGEKSEQNVMQAKANVDNLKAQLDSAKISFEATKQIYAQGGVSKLEYDNALAGLNQLQSGYDTAKHGYDMLIGTTLDETKQMALSQYKQAVAARDGLSVQLSNARELLNDATVKAPIAGVVSELNVKKDETISPQVIPCVITNMEKLEISISVSEGVITKINKLDKVDIDIDSLKGESFSGTITGLSPAASRNTNTYPVTIAVDNSLGKIKPGMFAKVKFKTNQKEDVVVAPRGNVITIGDENYVFVIDDENKAVRRDVVLGIDNGKNIEIVEGLNEGDNLVISGENYLKDGMKVRIVE